MSDRALTSIGQLARPLYPERSDHLPKDFERFGAFVEGVLRQRLDLKPDIAFAAAVAKHEPKFAALNDEELRSVIGDHRVLLRAGRLGDAHDVTFALIREVSRRISGIRHHDVQIMGGYALVKGRIAEMATGEGKTVTAVLAAAAAALAGERVHVITVNDYLSARDHETTQPVYDALGLTSASVTHASTPEERRAAYACDVTYCSNKEVAFDYLRDRLVLREQDEYSEIHLKLERLRAGGARVSKLVLRGLPFAIIDEADSVLIDEARTPLLLSVAGMECGVATMTSDGIAVARELVEDKHFTLDLRARNIELTHEGHERLDEIGEKLGGEWLKRILREEVATSALAALHLYRQGEHYVVRDGKVQIVDENTGRIMEDRQWNSGLHQLVEEKEGVEISPQNTSLAQITYQRLFRRYNRLSGMTGTAKEVTGELWSVYGLPVVSIPTHKPCRRKNAEPRAFQTKSAKIDYIAARAKALNDRQAPVLIGTRTITASISISNALKALGLDHQVLNAEQDVDEAGLIAKAGQVGSITVATNMAGRGTDIKLDEAAVAAGGLHVILTELHEAGRIDRQLIGRSARQGDPGHAEILVSLEDDIIAPLKRSAAGRAALSLAALRSDTALMHAFRYAQKRFERSHAKIRAALLRQDQSMGDAMAFTGKPE